MWRTEHIESKDDDAGILITGKVQREEKKLQDEFQEATFTAYLINYCVTDHLGSLYLKDITPVRLRVDWLISSALAWMLSPALIYVSSVRKD